MALADGMFSVASLFMALSTNAVLNSPDLAPLWRMKAPPRVIALGWSALLGGTLTMDNLRQRHVIAVNACPMFLAKESIDHLLLNSNSLTLYGRQFSAGSILVPLCPSLFQRFSSFKV